MKKLLYIAPVEIDYEKLYGVGKKIMNHYKVFSKYFDTYLIAYNNNDIVIYNRDNKKIIKNIKIHRRYALFNSTIELMKNEKFDCIYFRYPKSEKKLIDMLKKLKYINNNTSIVIEIPTYPYNGDMFISFKNFIIALCDMYYSKKLHKYVSRILTYSNDRKIFNINTINTINGVIFESIRQRSYIGNSKDINLIAVSGMWPCHGYDRLIRGMYNYYKNGGTRYIHFHIVGEGQESKKYKKLIEEYNLNNNVTLYGNQIGENLDKIYDISNIAVNSLAIHRIKLTNESTLKTKEYAAKGLPIISSYPIDVMSTNISKYILLVPPDESDIDINLIISFYDDIYSDNESIDKVSNEIRSLSKPICDMECTLKDVIKFFQY